MAVYIQKGMRVAVRHPDGNFIGIVSGVRADHPTEPNAFRIFVEPAKGGPEVMIDPNDVIHVIAGVK